MCDNRTKAEKERWRCADCNKDCMVEDKDYYMIQHDLWKKIGVGDGMLCMDCLETRLGHKLRKEEILLCPLTEMMNPYTMEILKMKSFDSEIKKYSFKYLKAVYFSLNPEWNVQDEGKMTKENIIKSLLMDYVFDSDDKSMETFTENGVYHGHSLGKHYTTEDSVLEYVRNFEKNNPV